MTTGVENPLPEVTFEPKSEWQKDECICCSETATMQAAAYGKSFLYGTATYSAVRCCEKESCRAMAATLAQVPFLPPGDS